MCRIGRSALLLTLLGLALLVGCGGSSGLSNQPATVTNVTTAQLQTLMAGAQPLVVLDVRSTAEYAAGHIPGSINIPVNELPARLGELNANTPTACVCVSGVRSAVAAQILDNAGFETVYDLQGGLATWDGPLEPRA